jgi:hypothetical protein
MTGQGGRAGESGAAFAFFESPLTSLSHTRDYRNVTTHRFPSNLSRKQESRTKRFFILPPPILPGPRASEDPAAVAGRPRLIQLELRKARVDVGAVRGPSGRVSVEVVFGVRNIGYHVTHADAVGARQDAAGAAPAQEAEVAGGDVERVCKNWVMNGSYVAASVKTATVYRKPGL